MIVTNIDYIPGARVVEQFGLVCGSTVRCKHIGKDWRAAIRNVFGGEIKVYTELMNESRQEATTRMIAQADSFGADAIINVRFSTSFVAVSASEIYVYGTAVKLERKE